MSKTYDMLADSLNEIITDYEENNGANLTHEVLTVDITEINKMGGGIHCSTLPLKRDSLA